MDGPAYSLGMFACLKQRENVTSSQNRDAASGLDITNLKNRKMISFDTLNGEQHADKKPRFL